MWIEARFRVSRDDLDCFTGDMLACGSLGSYENLVPSTEVIASGAPEVPTQTGDAEITVYFPDCDDTEALENTLKTNARATLLSLNRIPEGDWATAWKAYFKPLQLTPTIVICPSWENYTPKRGEATITLDPGMAFGTGQHDTTRFCAEFLEEVRRDYPQAQSVIDVGCGSGILSLVARALGFDPVVGVDNDATTLQTAEENRDRNSNLLNIRFATCNDTLTTPTLPQADILVANIMAEVLCALKPRFESLLKPGGLLILSGIIPERADKIETTFSGMTLLNKKASKDWRGYLYQRQNT